LLHPLAPTCEMLNPLPLSCSSIFTSFNNIETSDAVHILLKLTDNLFMTHVATFIFGYQNCLVIILLSGISLDSVY
jgi:hypothetical protein